MLCTEVPVGKIGTSFDAKKKKKKNSKVRPFVISLN